MRVLGISIACLAVLVGATGLQATTIEGDGSVIVESRSGFKNFADYTDVSTGFPNSWSNSTAVKSTAPGVSVGTGVRFNSSSGVGGAACYAQIAPTLPANAGLTWDLFVTTTVSNATTSVVSTITLTGATGLPATTTAFDLNSKNVWVLVGTLTMPSAAGGQVTIKFDETANNNRFYTDAFKLVPTPEPMTLALLAVGGLFLRRRRA